MRAAALADALEDFAPRRRVASFVMPFAVADAPEETSLLLVDASDPPSPSHAEAEALEALAERLRHEHDAELAAERERHAAELAALNERIGELVGTTLVAEMETARDSVVSLVTSVVARILAPVLSSDVQGRSLIALAEVVRDAIDDAESTRVRISGSLAMYEALCRAVPDKVDRFDFTESASVDLSVRIDSRLFETRISEWSASLEEAMA